MQKLAISTLALNINMEFSRERVLLATGNLTRVFELNPPAYRVGDPTILSAQDLGMHLTQ